jgi:WD40 repeat protein
MMVSSSMAKAGERRIFISYARRDGAELVLRLEKDLTAAGFDVWLDTQRIRGGESWTVEIQEAIDRASVVLALLTPGSYRSEICRAEQLRSLRKDKCVIPLLAAPGSDRPLHLEAKNYRDFTSEGAYAGSFQLLLADIRARKGAALPPSYRTTPTNYISAPPTVANYIDRPEAIRALRDTLFGADGHRAIALTALEGMGGIGKTVLAQALFKDEVVGQAFPDGMVWITVGREPTHDWAAKLREITHVLGVSDEAVSPETLYKTTIASKAALIVIDDIWSKADLDPFLAESPCSRFLFTTRDASIAKFSGAREHRVDLLDAPQARELLALWAGLEAAQLPPAADDILRECGGLPLALSTVGALLREAAPAEWADTAELLRNAELAAIEEQLPPGQQSFFRAIEVSVKALEPKLQQQYGRLAVLLEDMPAPLPVLRTLWNVDEAEARRIGRRLADRSLAQRDGESANRLHDLQLDYVRARFRDREALGLIRGAVRLSAHVIEKDSNQFASQLVGRLLPHREAPAIGEFIDKIAAGAPAPWLRPLRRALHPPGTPLLRTLEGHSHFVYGVAVTPDGKRAVSTSSDHTLKVWDLDTGRALRTLEGHSASVHGVAVTRDGKRAVSASDDKTLKVWDLETGHALRTLEGHSEWVYGVAVKPDGKRAVSASGDETLKVWDLATGRALCTLKGHYGSVFGVAVTPDGKRAVSASGDETLKVWDLATGRALCTLEGHSADVHGVAVTPDGKRAVSASGDNTLKVWDLETGRALRTLEGHSASVWAVAVTPDGKRAVSASVDKTLKVWDLATGRAQPTLEGHSNSVYGVAVTPDGRCAVSASFDRTLKVWDLATGRALRTLKGHSADVNGVAVTPDGRRAVLASEDKTLKVWDLETGSTLRTLEGHSASVLGVAVTPDGKQAVSASEDKTLKVWDLETGRALRTLQGHSADVNGVAVTPGGKRAISASWDDTLKVWDLDTGRALRTLEGHYDLVLGVAVTPDGKRAVSASGDNTLKVWDMETGHALRTLEGHSDWVNGVAVTPDGRRAVSASHDLTLKVWDLDTGRALRTLKGHSDRVSGVAMTPDGKRAVSASDDKTLKVWDLETGLLIATFHCDGSARCCAFVDDQRIVAGDAGGRVYHLALVMTVTEP